jgi:polysaccharide pyruvyl transferase WcaK-like protein
MTSLVKRIARGLKRLLLKAPGHPGFLALVDRGIFLLPPRAWPGAPRVHVLLAPPGGGNIGDQAMVEAFLENVAGPVVVIARTADTVDIPAHESHRATLAVMESLIYEGGIGHFRDVIRLKRLLVRAKSFSIVGADIMDGAYNCRASANRANIARLARLAGIDTRILGFSWNGSPHPGARAALREASAAGVSLVVRDPVSAQRARADALDRVVEGADLVFSAGAHAAALPASLTVPLNGKRQLAVVNASELVGRAVDQLPEYSGIVRYLQEVGLDVVLLPHVSRSAGGDVRVCRQIFDALGRDRLHLVDRLLAPAEVRALCGRACLVVSGRMHLAIIALSAGVPAITLATQGKVEGLMTMFDMRDLCIEPRSGFGRDVIDAARAILSEPVRRRENIRSHLGDVRDRSQRNFAGLG